MKLTDPATAVPLIGEKYQKLLFKLNIKTVEDLLYHFPFRYEDFSHIQKISGLIVNTPATVYGNIENIKNIVTKNRKRITKAVLADETGKVDIIWFNQFFLVKNVKVNTRIGVSGMVGIMDGKPAFISPEYEIKGDKHTAIHTGRLVPVYPETRGVTSKWLRNKMDILLDIYKEAEIEFLPQEILQEHNFSNLNTSLKKIHFPDNQEDVNISLKRFGFEELFLLNLKSKQRKSVWQSRELAKKIALTENNKKILTNFILNLPFKLTNAQTKVTREIINDIVKDTPMNRLLEGDVGSGKTVVSAIAVLLTAINGKKTIMAVPTELLATQHYTTLSKMFENFNIKVGLFTGSKKEVGVSCQIIVGTHALLYSKIKIDDLALVIIDEQHRFGVEQRSKFLQTLDTNKTPHLLTMTATPIPRSLALTMYGDLDLSIIDELPKERQKVTTWVVPAKKRNGAYGWIKEKILKENAQVFVVCPLIEESEVDSMKNVKSAKEEHEKLQKIFPNFSIGLVHGKIKPKEKDKILNDFRDKKYSILVATPVVEVGIDIPNASIIIIETAERFGLASLHQLRGRVGRSHIKSYCLLFSDSFFAIKNRLKHMEKIHSGIKLAEIDLKFRGPGDAFGTNQHGILKLKVANIFDTKLLSQAKESADEYYKKLEKYPKLKNKLLQTTQIPVSPN
ncbi:MAG: ATP-dependent DNA helicase RecG [Patescibacteria group bacterium]|nr:ATP-dependent DNA helicase RecG [Patescibacteria group bacterium]